jgi:hypothetical protein
MASHRFPCDVYEMAISQREKTQSGCGRQFHENQSTLANCPLADNNLSRHTRRQSNEFDRLTSATPQRSGLNADTGMDRFFDKRGREREAFSDRSATLSCPFPSVTGSVGIVMR